MNRILVAGIGNIFKGDDAFGGEVAQRLGRKPLPAGVKVVDFGIRGIDLTYALLDGYDAAILVDAAQRGAVPGTVSIVAPEPPATELPQPAPAPRARFPSRTISTRPRCCGSSRRLAAAASASCSSPASRKPWATRKPAPWG